MSTFLKLIPAVAALMLTIALVAWSARGALYV
jgi:hypothetical protein